MSRQKRFESERGAIIIHVAIALIALLSFTAFVVDHGVMMVARRQAQNVADAAALAGAIAFAKDGGGEPAAIQAALHYAASNPIWGEFNSAANVDVTLSKAGTSIPPCGESPGCVKVDVYRNMPDLNGVVRGNPLPTYFAQLFGLIDQGVRATATAETSAGNLVRCLLPFAVADRWSDGTDNNIDIATYDNDDDHQAPFFDPVKGWSPNDWYEDAALGGIDFYVGPNDDDGDLVEHTGWTVDGDYGRQLILKDGEVGQFSAGWSMKVDLPGSVGADDFRDDIKGCHSAEVGIAPEDQDCSGYPTSGTTIEEAKAGCLGVSTGVSTGPTEQGVEGGGPSGPEGELGIVPDDPNAQWSKGVNLGPQGQVGGVINTVTGDPYMNTSRIRPVAIFDIAHYMAQPACRNLAGTGCVIKVANIIGFFVEGMCDTVRDDGLLEPGQNCDPNPSVANRQVVGRISTLPSSFAAGVGNVSEDAAFLIVIRLVR